MKLVKTSNPYLVDGLFQDIQNTETVKTEVMVSLLKGYHFELRHEESRHNFTVKVIVYMLNNGYRGFRNGSAVLQCTFPFRRDVVRQLQNASNSYTDQFPSWEKYPDEQQFNQYVQEVQELVKLFNLQFNLENGNYFS